MPKHSTLLPFCWVFFLFFLCPEVKKYIHASRNFQWTKNFVDKTSEWIFPLCRPSAFEELSFWLEGWPPVVQLLNCHISNDGIAWWNLQFISRCDSQTVKENAQPFTLCQVYRRISYRPRFNSASTLDEFFASIRFKHTIPESNSQTKERMLVMGVF